MRGAWIGLVLAVVGVTGAVLAGLMLSWALYAVMRWFVLVE